MEQPDDDTVELEQVLQERYDGWTLARQTAFIEALSANPNVAAACREVGLGTTSAYRLRERSQSFRRAWDAALARNRLDLERTAMEWAIDGLEEPVFNRTTGEKVGTRRRRSPGVLMFMLRAADPAKYGNALSGPARGGRGEGKAVPDTGTVLTDMPKHDFYWKPWNDSGTYTNPYGVPWDGTFAGACRLLEEADDRKRHLDKLTGKIAEALHILGWTNSILAFVQMVGQLSRGEDVFDEMEQWGMTSPWSEAERRSFLEGQRASVAVEAEMMANRAEVVRESVAGR